MLPKDLVKPAVNYTYPSERAYLDESTSTLANGKVFDETKSGKDYGIKDPDVTELVDGTESETGNGAGTAIP
ncbi:hypothetical protein [Acinetobacter soli]|uniref:hypothetical protein n=1 Tax=Acinetobacter soli TaxID=487316 RepID=UPI0012504C6B|nr:hypothetical protein [Acinetobacter soli]